jgi:hypothetical protein
MRDLFLMKGAIAYCVLLVSDMTRRPFGRVVELAETDVLLGISLKRFCVGSGAQQFAGSIAVVLSKWIQQWKRRVFI